MKCSLDLPALAGQEFKKRFYREGPAGQAKLELNAALDLPKV